MNENEKRIEVGKAYVLREACFDPEEPMYFDISSEMYSGYEEALNAAYRSAINESADLNCDADDGNFFDIELSPEDLGEELDERIGKVEIGVFWYDKPQNDRCNDLDRRPVTLYQVVDVDAVKEYNECLKEEYIFSEDVPAVTPYFDEETGALLYTVTYSNFAFHSYSRSKDSFEEALGFCRKLFPRKQAFIEVFALHMSIYPDGEPERRISLHSSYEAANDKANKIMAEYNFDPNESDNEVAISYDIEPIMLNLSDYKLRYKEPDSAAKSNEDSEQGGLEMKMKMLMTKLTFLWDDGDDTKLYIIKVPKEVTSEEVEDILKKEHEYLCREDETDLYGIEGRCPDTLLEYVCSKYGWKYAECSFDIVMELN